MTRLRTTTRAALLGLAALLAAGCAMTPTAPSGPAATAAAATPRSLALRQGQLSFIRQGQGPAVVIVHGVGGHKEDWLPIVQALAADHTVLAVDMLGFGGSSKDLPEITIATQADAIAQLLQHEGIAKTSLIGNSVGGWVAASFAAQHPQATDRVVLVDAAGFKAMFDGPPPVNLYPANVDEMQQLQGFMRASDTAHTRAYAEKALAALDASGDKQAAATVFKGLFASPRLEELGPRIQSPTLVVWGGSDKLFPLPVSDLVTHLVPGARKVVIDAAGHFPHADQPQRFIEVVRPFLKS
jgi:triacylglycerol lipase